MASTCNDERAAFGVMSGHDRKTLSLSGRSGAGVNGSLHPRREVQLAQDVLHMDLHRGLGNAQRARNLLVAGATRDLGQDLLLTG